MKYVFKTINRFESKIISRKQRKSIWYLVVKLILLCPLILLGLFELAIKKLYTLAVKGRIKRDAKPDIVFSNIVAGFAGLAFPNEKTEILAQHRAKICAQCPSAIDTGLYTMIVDNRTSKIQGMKCNECGCNLSAKVRSANDYCPLGKW